jgi:hypothetical protein
MMFAYISLLLLLLVCFPSELTWNYGSYRLLGRVISPVIRPLPTQDNINTEETRTDIHALNGIRTHDPSVWAGEVISCLRPHSHCDRRIDFVWNKRLMSVEYYKLQRTHDMMTPDWSTPFSLSSNKCICVLTSVGQHCPSAVDIKENSMQSSFRVFRCGFFSLYNGAFSTASNGMMMNVEGSFRGTF